MRLQPRRPPGHANRKALAYAGEICSLRSAGHSYAAIREALEDAGVLVSLSTVRREVLKGGLLPPPDQAERHEPVAATSRQAAARRIATISGTAAAPSPTAVPLPGRSVADAFMRGRPTNPLFLTETQG